MEERITTLERRYNVLDYTFKRFYTNAESYNYVAR